jgi:hypothetical protein
MDSTFSCAGNKGLLSGGMLDLQPSERLASALYQKMKILSLYQNTSIGIQIVSKGARKEQMIVIATAVAVQDCRAKE